MNKDLVLKFMPVYLLVAVLFGAAIFLRPVLPIDETRYLTVAWELYLHHDYSLPTLNFEPYHHKPPLLFFLIDTAWDILGGVSRWGALVPFFISALAFIFMTRGLGKRLFPENEALAERLPYLALASFPFLIYGTIVMFDIMLTVFVLGFYLSAFSYVDKPKIWKILMAGVFLGLGGLTKGPVVLVYTFLPLLCLCFWEKRSGVEPLGRVWTKFLGGSFFVGMMVVGIWLVDLVFEVGPDFLHTLIFTQTLERIDGKMESSHARPLYFYMPFLPVLFMPWALFPAFWKNAKSVVSRIKSEAPVRVIALWFGACFICFSLISGKQPHYLVPLLPPALIFIGLCLERVNLKILKITALALVTLIVAGQAVARVYIFPKYDLERFAQIVKDNPDKDWAFVRKYQGELGFLGRIDHHIDSLEHDEVALWFKQHPDGYAIIRHTPAVEFKEYYQVYSMDYRSRVLGIFTLNPEVEKLKNLPEQ